MLPPLAEIRKRRVVLGISQRKLAAYLGISQSAIAKIEGGKMRPTYDLAKKIFDFLDSLQTRAIGLAGDICSRPVIYVDKDDNVGRAVKLLQDHGFKQLPVTDAELYVGSVSERSISRLLLKTSNPSSILNRKVSEIMEEAFPVFPEDSPVSNVILVLQRFQAVLTAKHGKVTGIITNADLLKLLAREM